MRNIPELQRDSMTHAGTVEVSAYVDFDHDPDGGDRPVEEIEEELRELVKKKAEEIDEELEGAEIKIKGKHQYLGNQGNAHPDDLPDTLYLAMTRGDLGQYWARGKSLLRALRRLEDIGVDRDKLSEAVPESEDVRVIKVTAHPDTDGLDEDSVYIGNMGGPVHPYGANTKEMDLKKHEDRLEDL